jgi:CDP-glycerol glycerophosphotransferase (TagB/SpsB family)
MNFAVFRPILDRLAVDERIESSVTSHHHSHSFYADLPLPPGVHVRSHFGAVLHQTDLAICPGFYFRGGKVGTRVQIFHGVSFKSYAVNEKLRSFDQAFVTGEFHRRQIERAGLGEATRLRRIGMPKTDLLVSDGPSREEVLRPLGLDPGRPAVLYAPTRSSEVGSSVDRFGLEILRALSGQDDFSVLIKLHDRSLPRWGRHLDRNWEEELAPYREHARIRFVETHDIVPLMAVADLLISDVSSVANEFLLRDRPIVYLDLPAHNEWIRRRAAELGEGDLLGWGREPGEVVADPADLLKAVRHGLAHPEEKSELRRRNAEVFFYHPGRATAAAVRAICEILELEPPERP